MAPIAPEKTSRAGHLPYLIVFASLALFVTRPLVSVFTTSVLGPAGDNLSFVWDFWWAKTAIATHQSLFWTPALFAPIGTSLATHTLVPLLSVSAALAFPRVPPQMLYNGALLLSVFLNFACAYAAAYTLTADRPASAFAAITFGAAPFLIVRAIGHLNVLSAWGLPLVLVFTLRYVRRPTIARALLVAIGLAAVAYTDYYFFIFAAAMVGLWLGLATWSVEVHATPLTPLRMRLVWTLAAILALVLVSLVLIAATGGADITAVGIRLRMTDTFNGRVIAGFAAVALALIWAWPAIRLRKRDEAAPPFRAAVPSLLAMAGALAPLLAPILIAGFNVWKAGDYSSQVYVWRNAPPGIDLASLILGNQLHPAIGRWTRAAYAHFGINGIEGAAWLGIVPMILVAAAWRRRGRPEVASAFWIGGFFFLWSLGPYLRVFNYNTGLMLPQTLLRFVPVAANARIPGRAFAVVQMMAALLGAVALSDLRRSSRHVMALSVLAVCGVLVDYWPMARPSTELDAPAVYTSLESLPEGNVLTIPIGMHDGFSQRGLFDNRLLFYQTIHGHPQMGGAISRISTRTARAYDQDPIVGPLLNLSEGRPAGRVAPDGCKESLACSARYLLVDEREASRELQRFVAAAFPAAALVARDGTTALYTTTP